MKYGIITAGTRGDVQPFVALAIGLRERGHDVTVIATEDFTDFVEGYDLKFIPLSANTKKNLQDPELLKPLKTGNILKFLYSLQKINERSALKINLEILEACKDLDILIAATFPSFIAYSIAEKFNKKFCMVILCMPITPTREFAHSFIGSYKKHWYNKLSYQLNKVLWLSFKKIVAEFRGHIGLPAKNLMTEYLRTNALTLYPMSRNLLHQPKDWPSNTHVTGFFTIPRDKRDNQAADKTPEGLKEWLAAGSKPIYVGFGSIPIPDTDKFIRIIEELSTRTDYRFVFCTGWTVIGGIPVKDNLFVVDAVNHEWLFPQCRLAIFHGGIGTLAAVLRAKLPMIVVSILGDQPHNGKLIDTRNLGIHIPFRKLSTEKLILGLEKVQSDEIIQNCIRVGNATDKEEGVRDAVGIIENFFN